ncbi:potassium transporter protein [Candidatus Scalindua japonica]|uniref:Trk system potassium uptake protein TrkA n=1 Tax=Candidatus Scalindua japonica TaxID=1284222 RepID=A0A286TZG8_9BACT|nr:Trk system potassium transporter TrkA [Candidatus Scalindua japonica]GAX61280.1 potassium transporter protein [Candidatus Scalindua japonica]
MKILIIGAGAVGFSIAKQLSTEGHDISVVDGNPKLTRKIAEKLDVSIIAGNATSPSVLESAGVQEADMVLAVTTSDEVNIVACILASKYSNNGKKIKIARIRNSEFTGSKSIFKNNGFCVDHMINPELIIVETILKILETPGATFAVDFPIGDVVLRGFHVPEDAPLVGLNFSELEDIEYTDSFLIVYIQRNDEMITPSHSTTIMPDDNIFVLISKTGLPYFLPMVNRRADEVEKIIIYKASRTGMLLAERLENSPIAVTIIEPEKDRAVMAAASLRNAVVLHGDATEIDVLKDAAVEITDIFIALSENEQTNLLTSLLAKKNGTKKTIVLTNEPELVHIINQVDVDVVVNPRLVTANEILQHVRRGQILSIAKLGDSEAEAIELIAEEGSEVVKKPLQKIRFPKNTILGAIVRNNTMLLPKGIEAINPGESVVVFTLPDDIERVQALFSKKK